MTTRWKRVLLWTGVALAIPLLLTATLFWWAGSEGSLARALQLAQRWLPPDQQLVATQVQGSLSGGGRIGQLRWSKPGLAVTLEDLRVDWSLQQLLGGELHVRQLAARRLHLRSTPKPKKPDQPFVMPSQVSLPIRLSIPLAVSRIEMESVDAAGAPVQRVLEDLAASYRYDGKLHTLRLENVRYGQSQAQASAQLDGRTLALAAQLDATLRDLVPGTPFAMQARLTTRGSLAGGEAAALEMTLEARQQDVIAGDAALVTARATLHPWRGQPVQQLDLRLNRLNAHAFHAAAPATALRGQATVNPAPDGMKWIARADISNDLAGEWDHLRLPLRHLGAQAEVSAEQADIGAALAELGKGGSTGVVALRGSVPWERMNQAKLQLDLQQVDLRSLVSTLPRTSFTGPVHLDPLPLGSRIRADVGNESPAPLDADGIPLDHLLADVRRESSIWRIETLDAQSGTGHVQLQGTLAPGTAVDLRAEFQRLPLRQIHGKLATDASTRLSGTVLAAGTFQGGIAFDADVDSDAPGAQGSPRRGEWEVRSIQAKGRLSSTQLTIDRLHLDALRATADASDIRMALPRPDSIRGRLSAAAPGLALQVDAAMSPHAGGGTIALQLTSAQQTAGWLRGLPWIGARLADLHARGAATVNASWQGNWQQWMAAIHRPALQPKLHLDATVKSAGLAFQIPAMSTHSAIRLEVRSLDVNAQGSPAAAMAAIQGDARINDTRAALDVRIRTTQMPGSGNAPRWIVAVENFSASMTPPDQDQPWQLRLADNLQISAELGHDIELQATAGSATLLAPSTAGSREPLDVAWQPMTWRRTAEGAMTLQSAGTVSGIQPAWLDALPTSKGAGLLADAGVRTDMVLSGEWDARLTDHVALRAHLKRERGDIVLVKSSTSADIRALELTLQAADENVTAALNWDSGNAGVITARVATQLRRRDGGWSLPPDAPLSGVIKAKLQDLSTLAFLAPPGWRIQGGLGADVRLAGSLRNPQLEGGIEGNQLSIRSLLDGVDLHNGTLRAELRDSRMEVSELTFEGGTGSRAYVRGFSGNRTPPPTDRGRMLARGFIDWNGVANVAAAGSPATGSRIVLNLDAELQRMQVLVRHDRQMTLSGRLSASLYEGALRVRGDLRVDRASIVLPEASAPTLGDDVVITRKAGLRNAGAVESRQAHGELQTREPMDLEIRLDLGRDLALEGQGITTRLEGDLTVRSASAGSDPFRVFGEVRTVEGRYRAWGQALDVETGIARFNGPYGNPSLDLLAIRPKIDVRAGVRVTGTLLAPRVQLFSDPELPEGEKLSWVVLGRATLMTGTEGASMQQAALGLAAGQLGGRLASGLGLDELGLSEAGVSIGKRISNELYLTYQQGLAGAASTLFIFYDITRRLTIRAQASEASALDLVYTIKFD